VHASHEALTLHSPVAHPGSPWLTLIRTVIVVATKAYRSIGHILSLEKLGRNLRGTLHQCSILNGIKFGKNPLVLFSNEFCVDQVLLEKQGRCNIYVCEKTCVYLLYLRHVYNLVTAVIEMG
jgi:hypothetical protein